MDVKSTLPHGLRKSDGNRWNRDDYSDFTIVVEGTPFSCHRFILSACSGFFQGLFRSQMKESIERVAKLDTMTKETFEIIINSIYKGTDGLTEDTVLDVWSASEMLQIDYLIDDCKQFVMHNLTVDNCFCFLNQAMTYSAQEIIDRCLVIISKNFEQVRNTKSFLQLPLDYFYKVIESDILATSSEDSVVDAILTWMEYKPDPEYCSWLYAGTLDAKAADEILVADISTYSSPVTGTQEVKYGDQGNENISQDNEKDDQEMGNDDQEMGNDDQETGNDDQENGADVIVKENVDQLAAFVIRNDENSSISEGCENRVDPESNIITSGGSKTMCNKNSTPQTDSKETNRKQHFLKLFSSCRLFIVTPICLENLLENHIDLFISIGAYNMVLNALKYSLSVALRHEAWPEAAVHRVSSSYKHVMVFISGNQFKAYSLDAGRVHVFAKVPGDYSRGNNIIVFDNSLYFAYQSIDRHNIFSMMTKQNSWVPVTGLYIYPQMLLAHGNYVYDLYTGHNKFTLNRWSSAHGHNTWMIQTCNLTLFNSIIRFQLYIVVLITAKSGNNVTAHCFNTETNNIHAYKTAMGAYAYNMISFSSNENVYILDVDGSLWKVFSADMTPVDFVLVTKLWDSFFNCNLRGCVLYRHKLYIFYQRSFGEKPNTLLTSLPGICEDIIMIEINSMTECLPMVLPGSWLTS